MLTVQPRFVRFRILNGAVSRALQLNFQDATGKKYNNRCRIVGSDGGVIGRDRNSDLGGRAFPTMHGLFTSNAYRWDVVCDFRGLEGSLFLTNEPNDELMKPIPAMFCHSHLLMRIDVTADPSKPPTQSLFPDHVDESPAAFDRPDTVPDYTKLPEGGTVVDMEVGQATIAASTAKALSGNFDRRIDFGKQSDYWVIGDNLGWDHNTQNMARALDMDAAQVRFRMRFECDLSRWITCSTPTPRSCGAAVRMFIFRNM